MSVVTLAVVNDAEIVVQIGRESFNDLTGKAVVQAVSADVGRVGDGGGKLAGVLADAAIVESGHWSVSGLCVVYDWNMSWLSGPVNRFLQIVVDLFGAACVVGVRPEMCRPWLDWSVTEINPVVQVGAVTVGPGPFMTLEPMTAGSDHMDTATGDGSVKVAEPPFADAVVGIGEIRRLQAVTQERLAVGHQIGDQATSVVAMCDVLSMSSE